MLRQGGLVYRQGKGGPKTVEDHCGKAGRSKVKMPHQHKREALLLLVGKLAKSDCSSDVGCSVEANS